MAEGDEPSGESLCVKTGAAHLSLIPSFAHDVHV